MEKKLNVGQHSLMGYLPSLVTKNIVDGLLNKISDLPIYYSMNSVCLMADISGFTMLSETYSAMGRMGAEVLAFMLNRYMEQMITLIGKNGGDIFKFAGDALLVIWPESSEKDYQLLCRRAIQCAIDIQNKVSINFASLSVKIGIGIGNFKIAFVGGQFDRCEYLVIGEGMRQACESETHAGKGGEIIVSKEVYALINGFVELEECQGDGGHGPSDPSEKYYKIVKNETKSRVPTKADAFIMRTKFSHEKLRDNNAILKRFVPAAITLHLDIEQEFWSKELRMISVMFLNLGITLKNTETKEGMERVQKIVKTCQRCIYRTRGSLNKFLMDDKGSVMLICWGLPPLSATDDHLRSVLTGFDLIKELKQLDCSAYIGISTGSAFSGVCGTIGNRKEYSLLSEIVNLSARNMQKSIEISKKKKPADNYNILICKRTADLISNKIPSFCRVVTKLKGFKDYIHIYCPKNSLLPLFDLNKFTILSDIKTHAFNISYHNPTNEPCEVIPDKEDKAEEYKQIMKKISVNPDLTLLKADSTTIIGRDALLNNCYEEVANSIKKNLSSFILVKGIYGSGKSLFIRCLLKKILDVNYELTKNHKYKFIFNSFQLPNTLYDPMNGFTKIMREIYNLLLSELPSQKFQKTINIASEKVTLLVDKIGEILFDTEAFSYTKYIEEILGIQMDVHYTLPNDANFEKFFFIRNLDKRDTFFTARKFNKSEKTICNFFLHLIKRYAAFLQQEKLPLIFVIEDCNQIDEISIILLKMLKIEGLPKTIIITSYQECVNGLMLSQYDNFGKTLELYNAEKTYVMESISDRQTLRSLLRFYLIKNEKFKSMEYLKLNPNTIHNLDKIKNDILVNDDLIDFILSKSFNGNPLLVLDLINALVDKNLVIYSQNKLHCSSFLSEMIKFKDWSKFEIPYRIEKLIGNIIDNLNPKEIIILKCASVIGNIFDMNILYAINPFVTIMNEDLLAMIYNFEQLGIIEILSDLDPNNLVAKFSLPFFREVLYLRMLSEQKTAIHSEIARNLKTPKFSYHDFETERQILLRHLIESEKTVMSLMSVKEDKSNNTKEFKVNSEILFDEEALVKQLVMNNLKIYIVKKICDKIKIIDLKLNEDANKTQINDIISEVLTKKSDSNITWEDRFVAITKNKFIYWYKKEDHQKNKMPLGFFELKEINTIDILPDYQIGGKQNIIKINVNSFYKKDSKKGERSFYFCTNDKSKLYEWVITLNFLRVKAIYDEFKTSFGVINLPMNHEVKSSLKKKVKLKLNLAEDEKKKRTHFSYSSFIRKSMMGSSTLTTNLNPATNFKKRNSNVANFVQMASIEELDQSKTLNKIKESIDFIWNVGILILSANIQKKIFDNPFTNSVLNENKMLTIPSHIYKKMQMVAEKIEEKMNEEKKDNDYKSLGNIQTKNIASKTSFNSQNSLNSSNRERGMNNYNQINVIDEDEENEETYQNNETKKETQQEDTKYNDTNYNQDKQIELNKNIESKAKNDYDSMYSNNASLFKPNTQKFNVNFKDIYTNKEDENLYISSNNYGEKNKFLENNSLETSNKYTNMSISKFPNNDTKPYQNTFQTINNNLNFTANRSDKNVNKNLTNQNSLWEDSIHNKFKNLEMTNDDLDEMFNVFSNNKKK